MTKATVVTREFEVKDDSISMTVYATSRDDAARQFAASEGIDAANEAELRAKLEAIGSWLNIIED